MVADPRGDPWMRQLHQEGAGPSKRDRGLAAHPPDRGFRPEQTLVLDYAS
jgi:hypothetical protein